MFATALALLVVAAPVPKTDPEAARIERLFGKPVDLDKDCKFRMDGDKLLIDVPDAAHHVYPFDPVVRRPNAPRTTKPATGNFAASVKVRLQPLVTGEGDLEVAAGLCVRADDRNGVALWMCWKPGRVGQMPPPLGLQASFWRPDGNGGMSGHGPIDSADPLWLRLTRTGNRAAFAYSRNGETWQSSLHLDGDLPKRVEIGVFAAQNVAEGFTATFENFKIDPLPTEGNK